MKKLKKLTLECLSEHRNGPYRVYQYFTEDRKTSTKEEALKQPFPSSAYRACFSGYLRSAPLKEIEGAKDYYTKREYLPLFVKYDMTFKASLVDDALGLHLDFVDLYRDYFNKTMATLDSYIKIEYDTKHKLISVLPDREVSKVYILAYLTKLRTLFELPYTLINCFAEIFQDDFPELELEEIAYLLGVFLLKAPTGHGFFNYLNMGQASKFMSFSDIMKNAEKTKYHSINSGVERIIPSIRMEGFNHDKFRYSQDIKESYNNLLQDKESIINTFIKKVEYEKSVPSI